MLVIHAVNLIVQHFWIIKRPQHHENMLVSSLRCDYVAVAVMSLLGLVIAVLEYQGY
ncbi:hypothetical protein VPHK469_0127 [Vibrio phage K469]